jgi:hypothetical protein
LRCQPRERERRKNVARSLLLLHSHQIGAQTPAVCWPGLEMLPQAIAEAHARQNHQDRNAESTEIFSLLLVGPPCHTRLFAFSINVCDAKPRLDARPFTQFAPSAKRSRNLGLRRTARLCPAHATKRRKSAKELRTARVPTGRFLRAAFFERSSILAEDKN